MVAALFVASMAFSTLAAEEITNQRRRHVHQMRHARNRQCGCAIQNGRRHWSITADKNAVAKDFHENICKANAKVVATGTVSDKDGKKSHHLEQD